MKSSNPRPLLALIGGFLGAGKTSLILSAARILGERGMRCAAILNDQGEELVDTQYAELHGTPAREITGGCFCCRFSQLRSSIENLRLLLPDIIFAEPVGSCTDLVASVIEPLREEFELCRVAPFTVLIDPARIAEFTSPAANSLVTYLWRRQVEEADLVCLTKADRYPLATSLPGVHAHRISAKTGAGVAEWLDQVLCGSRSAGDHLLDIDYERYTAAEAALAWMNLSLHLELSSPATPAALFGPFLDCLAAALDKAGVRIVHLKLIDRTPAGWLKAAICTHGEDPIVEGDLDASPAKEHEVLVNLRALGDPVVVRQIAEYELRQLGGTTSAVHLVCFSPQPPKPERRTVRS